MYSARWTQGLRQGDVVGPLLYPKLKGPPQLVARPAGWAGDALVNEALEFPATEKYAVVVSHDCEFTEAKRDQFLLARVDEFNERVDADTRAAIRAANDAVRVEDDEGGGQRYDYLDTFVLDPLEDCFAGETLIKFATISPWPRSMLKTIIELKRAELEHEHRVRLRRKLGFFLGRDADDVPDAEKIDRPDRGNEEPVEDREPPGAA